MNFAAPALHRRTVSRLVLLAGTATGIALLTYGPAARADVVDLPLLPDVGASKLTFGEAIGVLPFYDGTTYTQGGSYTDLLGDTASNHILEWDRIVAAPANFVDPSIVSVEAHDPVGSYGILPGDNAAAGGSTFELTSTTSGLFNYFESTPVISFYDNAGADNVNDVLVYAPNGSAGDLSAVDFGIQYLDLPSAATPVDEVNLLGAGGEILASVPVSGDLLSSL